MARIVIALLVFSLTLAAHAGSQESSRIIRANVGDTILIDSKKLSCSVGKGGLACRDGAFPQLTFYATTRGGEKRHGEFYIFRMDGSYQMETLFRYSRRK